MLRRDTSTLFRTLFLLAIGASVIVADLAWAPAAFGQEGRRGFRSRRFGNSQRSDSNNESTPSEKPAEEESNDNNDKTPSRTAQGPSTSRSAVDPIKRPNKPKQPPKPEELKLTETEEGKIEFTYRGAPWQTVLEQIAEATDMSLDWQELPGDYLNLKTRRAYTAPEARDLINRHLLARGYTMVRNGEVLSVVKTQDIDPAMVPRVTPEDLDEREPHEFVKTSFSLDWMIAEDAAEELGEMLSPNGKLIPLKATNRLEAIDTASNLRSIRRVLEDEQSVAGQERLIRNFKLKHTRAVDVIRQVEGLLGIERPPELTASNSRDSRLAMMLAQRGSSSSSGSSTAEKSDVHLVVNQRENSILAQAPPQKMVVIGQAIKELDVPSGGSSLLANINRMQVYRLASIDPQPLVDVLETMGSLDPETTLQVDTQNKSIIAYATLADHVTIRQLVDKLDGTGRNFYVVQLRRLEADYVAGSIQFMISGDKGQEQSSRRRYYYYFEPEQDEEKDEFRVEADVQYNRLMLWANEVEMKEVENLLVKLGEVPSRDGRSANVRVFDVSPGKQTEELLEKLRKAWPSLGPNKLELPESAPQGDEQQPDGQPSSESEKDPTADAGIMLRDFAKSGKAQTARPVEVAVPVDRPSFRLAQLTEEEQAGDSTESAAEPADDADQPDDETSAEDEASDAAQSEDADQQTETQSTQENRGSEDGSEPADSAAEPEETAAPADEDEVLRDRNSDIARQLQMLQNEQAGTTSQGEPPIKISIGPDGRLVYSSEDTEALDRLEELLMHLAPQRKQYEIFHLRYAAAYWVAFNLEDFFGEKEEGNSGRSVYYFYDDYNSNDSGGTNRLSQRQPLKFIPDDDTNTILVQGATPQQLQTIRELIEIYDTREPANPETMRQTQIFRIQYSRANIIGEVIKDVYRDLLSENDKALQNANPNKPERTVERAYTYIYGEDGNGQPEAPVKFKGLLSVGIDELSNTIVVSATGTLLQNISQMIEHLDEMAKPSSTVQVLKVNGRLDTLLLQQRLAEILGKNTRAKNAAQAQQQQPGDQQPNNNNGDNNRRRSFGGN